MDNKESIPFPLATAMVVGALVSVPVLGWWPLVGVAAAVGSAAWFITKLK